MRLHPLISPGAALALLVVVTICSAILAVLQNAMGLAVVAALALRRADPDLHRQRQPCSAVQLLRPAQRRHLRHRLVPRLAAAQPGRLRRHLRHRLRLGTALLYTGAVRQHRAVPGPVLPDVRRDRPALRPPQAAGGRAGACRARRTAALVGATGRHIDATVLFGPPLVGFGLQCAVIGHIDFGMAFSAPGPGALLHGPGAGAARPCFGRTHQPAGGNLPGAGVVFGTLAIPLGLDARWTSAAWAVEGAGIYGSACTSNAAWRGSSPCCCRAVRRWPT